MTEKKLIPFLSLVFSLFFVSYSFAAVVHFQWGTSSGVVEGYRIYYGSSHEGPYPNLLAQVGGTTTEHFASLNEGQEYYLVVRAFNDYGESGNSNEVIVGGGSQPNPEIIPISFDEMTLIYVDSEEPRGENGGINAIDGNPSTMWHTEWSANNPAHPHEIVIDLGYERQVCGFNYLPRQDVSYNGGIAEYEFYVSIDSENWGSPVASGIFPSTKTKQEVVFYQKYARYVKLVALSEINGHPWTSAAEIEVMEQIGGHANIAPNAVIHTDVTSGYVPLTVQFDASGSSDPDGGIVSYQWNFGDGEFDIGEAVGHTFQTTGEYTVTLTVEDNEGATAQAQITITVEEESAEVTLIPYSEMTLVYVDSEEPRGENGGINAIDGNPSTMWHTEWYANDPAHPHEIVIDLDYERQVCGFNYLPRQGGSYNGGIAEYEFYVSVDSENWGSPVASGIFPYTKTKQEVVFYQKYARYVKLVALSEVNGNPWTSAAEIEVMEQIGGHANIAPEAVIHTDVTSGYVPLTVQFDASGSSDPDGVIVSYQWNFGDGKSDIGEAVGHTFQTTGEYTVTLTVEDNEGATAQAQITITVEEESAEETLIPYSEMTLVYVDSEETNKQDGRGINAIDGNPSTMWHTEWSANNPVHPHEIVIDLGYERQVCGFNYLPRQDVSYNGGIAEYEFYVSIDSENWGSPVASGIFPITETKQEVVFYQKYARYVKLVALSEINGHPWTSAAEIEVMEQIGGHANIAPEAVIHTDVTSGYVPLTVQFDASGSSDPDGGIVSYQWNFGDGEFDIGEAVGHTFQTTGEYTVTLTVEDNEGATAQAQITITVEEESAEVTLIPYSEMTLVYVDSEETRGENYRGINAIDGNPSTMWHTEWKAKDPVHPHEIVIDLGYERQVCGFNYLPRQGGNYNGGIAEYEFYVSADSENWGSPIASGIFPRTKAKQEVVFYPKYARYVKLVAFSEVNGNPWTSAAEIEVMER